MNNTISLLQIAWKAGKVVFGDRLIPAIQKNEVFLVIMSSSCGNNRKKKLKDKCAFDGNRCFAIQLHFIAFHEFIWNHG